MNAEKASLYSENGCRTPRSTVDRNAAGLVQYTIGEMISPVKLVPRESHKLMMTLRPHCEQ